MQHLPVALISPWVTPSLTILGMSHNLNVLFCWPCADLWFLSVSTIAVWWTARATQEPRSLSIGQTRPCNSPWRPSSSLPILTLRWETGDNTLLFFSELAQLWLWLKCVSLVDQHSLQTVCHIRGTKSCTQVLHVQREQVNLDAKNTLPRLTSHCFLGNWAYSAPLLW